jgi:NAD(P)-dependent dehydrogenase (short-subunit alcohol dehydrogenase family)/acyl carrier protein
MARVYQQNPAAVLRALGGLARYRASQNTREIPVQSFSAPAVEDAFNACLCEAHFGRVVVDMADKIVPLVGRLPRPAVRPDAAYLVTGGFGGIGLETIRWLCAQGAKHVAVLSRSGPSTERAREVVRRLEEGDVHILHEQVDIADREKLNSALGRILAQVPPVRGVIHCAGVLADVSVEAMDASLVDRAMDAKAKGALHLHQAFENQDLDFFVCYSSITATLGNAGQLSYAAANGFLHGLVMHRRARGLPGTCINWGPVADVGMAARDQRVAERLARAGLAHLPLAQVFEILEEALAEDWMSFDAVDIDWAVWSWQATLRERLRLSEVLPGGGATGEEASLALRSKVFSLDANKRRALLFDLVVEITAAALSIGQSRIDSSSNLRDLGTDSIMAAEISHAIFGRTGVRLRTLYLTRGPALLDMAEKIEEVILSGAAGGLGGAMDGTAGGLR